MKSKLPKHIRTVCSMNGRTLQRGVRLLIRWRSANSFRRSEGRWRLIAVSWSTSPTIRKWQPLPIPWSTGEIRQRTQRVSQSTPSGPATWRIPAGFHSGSPRNPFASFSDSMIKTQVYLPESKRCTIVRIRQNSMVSRSVCSGDTIQVLCWAVPNSIPNLKRVAEINQNSQAYLTNSASIFWRMNQANTQRLPIRQTWRLQENNITAAAEAAKSRKKATAGSSIIRALRSNHFSVIARTEPARESVAHVHQSRRQRRYQWQ